MPLSRALLAHLAAGEPQGGCCRALSPSWALAFSPSPPKDGTPVASEVLSALQPCAGMEGVLQTTRGSWQGGAQLHGVGVSGVFQRLLETPLTSAQPGSRRGAGAARRRFNEAISRRCVSCKTRLDPGVSWEWPRLRGLGGPGGHRRVSGAGQEAAPSPQPWGMAAGGSAGV